MIAVTGATGLLGSFIVRRLVNDGAPVVAIRRAGGKAPFLSDVADMITWRTADVLDPVSLEEAFQGITHVIHAAGLVSFNPSRRKQIFEVNVTGTRNVVNACLAGNVSRMLHVSSVAALGRQKGQYLIDEDNKWSDSSLNSVYAESKYFAELEVFRGGEEGLSAVIVNPSVVLGPGDWSRSSARLFEYVWREKRFYIDADLNYTDARDVADLAVRLLHSNERGERFIVNAGAIPFADFFRAVASRFGKRPPSVKLGKKTLLAAAFAERFRARLSGSEPLLTSETARLAGTRFLYNSGKIRKMLGFEFRPIDRTLDWCCEEYLNLIAKK